MTKCAYQLCEKDLDQDLIGRPKRYCSDAHRQADYRRRHPEMTYKEQLRAVRRRLFALERFAIQHAPPGYRLERNIPIITLTEMIRDHGIATGYVERGTKDGLLKPVDGMLDAHEQEKFYLLCEGQPGWHVCSDCPHGVIP